MGSCLSAAKCNRLPIRRSSFLWQDRQVRWDQKRSVLALPNGEVVRQSWENVADTKGENGIGELRLTNLRLIWVSSNDKNLNISIGMGCIVYMHYNMTDSSEFGRVRALNMMTEYSGKFEFTFVVRPEEALDLFNTIDCALRRFRATKEFRDIILRDDSTFDEGQLAVSHGENLLMVLDAGNLTSVELFEGSLQITDKRIAWTSTYFPGINVSVPYLQMRSVGARHSHRGIALVMETHMAGCKSFVLGFRIQSNKFCEVLTLITDKLCVARSDPFYGPLDGCIQTIGNRLRVVSGPSFEISDGGDTSAMSQRGVSTSSSSIGGSFISRQSDYLHSNVPRSSSVTMSNDLSESNVPTLVWTTDQAQLPPLALPSWPASCRRNTLCFPVDEFSHNDLDFYSRSKRRHNSECETQQFPSKRSHRTLSTTSTAPSTPPRASFQNNFCDNDTILSQFSKFVKSPEESISCMKHKKMSKLSPISSPNTFNILPDGNTCRVDKSDVHYASSCIFGDEKLPQNDSSDGVACTSTCLMANCNLPYNCNGQGGTSKCDEEKSHTPFQGKVRVKCPPTENTNSNLHRKSFKKDSIGGVTEVKKKYHYTSKCVVCLTEENEIAFDPCGHLCCCSSCSQRLQFCPICRSSIEKPLRIFIHSES